MNQVEIPGIFSLDDHTRRNIFKVTHRSIPPSHTIALKLLVNILRRRTSLQPECPRPGFEVRDITVTATLGTRAVPRGQGGGFIQEEQFRVVPRLHDFPPPILEREQTGHPGITRRLTNDVFRLIASPRLTFDVSCR